MLDDVPKYLLGTQVRTLPCQAPKEGKKGRIRELFRKTHGVIKSLQLEEL